MKTRNPLFVAGFPYSLILFGYMTLNLFSYRIEENAKTLDSTQVAALLAALTLVLIGAIYSFYWLISTARVLRKHGNQIPHALLLIVPLANYWWMWKYGQAVERYTHGKLQGILAFIVIALLGAIGMGILQDTYNKLGTTQTPQV